MAGEAAGRETDNGAWQIGCYTRPWAQFDYREALDAIAEAGFRHAGMVFARVKGVEVFSASSPIDDAVRAGEEARKRGLDILSIYAGGINVEKREQGAADLRHLVDLCAAAKAKTLLLCGVDDPKLHDTCFGAIADGCDYAAEKKIGLTVKPHGDLIGTGPQLRKAIEKVHHKNCTIWYDAGNILYYSDGKLNPVDDAATVDGLVTGWSIKDYRHPKQVDVTPGDGQLDFRGVLARLKRGGFTHGPLVVETLTLGDRPHLLNEAKKARRFVEAMVRGTA
jgi:sugar phosphate isomerase/epimerase